MILEAPSTIPNFCYQHGVQFENESAYKHHVEWCERFLEVPNLCTHINKDGYMCAKEFQHVASLLFHSFYFHNVYLCVHCKRKFTQLDDLERHSHDTIQALESKEGTFNE